jgi:hypothetical protein
VDPAVALVQAYLQLNGYLTVTEFPITSGSGSDAGQAITDIDLIALRFPNARGIGGWHRGSAETDPILRVGDGAMDLLICEVKEGKARLNPNLTRSDTLAKTLARVGCCPPAHVGHHVESLIHSGVADMDHGGTRCRARIAVFAGRLGHPARTPLVVSLGHAACYVRDFLDDNREMLQAARFSQPALAQLSLLTKLGLFDSPVVPPR